MTRRWVAPTAVVLLATAMALGQATWNRSLVRREMVLSEREAPIAWTRHDQTALWLRLEYATPLDSGWGGWLGATRLAAMGIDTSRAALRARPAIRPGYAVLELDGEAWHAYVQARVAQREREVAGDSVLAHRDSLARLFLGGLEAGSHLVLVDAGADAAALAARYPDAGRHLILPASVRTYNEYRFNGVGAPPDTILGARIDLEHARLLVSGRSASGFRAEAMHGYRAIIASGRAWGPWVRRLE